MASVPLVPVIVTVALIVVVILPWPSWSTAVSSDMSFLIAVEADEVSLPVVVLRSGVRGVYVHCVASSSVLLRVSS